MTFLDFPTNEGEPSSRHDMGTHDNISVTMEGDGAESGLGAS